MVIASNKYLVYIYKGQRRFLEKECRTPELAIEYARQLGGQHEKAYACIEYYPDNTDQPKEYPLVTITGGREYHGEQSPGRTKTKDLARKAAALRQGGRRRGWRIGDLFKVPEPHGEAPAAEHDDRTEEALRAARRRANLFSVLIIFVLLYAVLQTVRSVMT